MWFMLYFMIAVDGSTAGSGNLEILVNGGHVTSNVRNLGHQKFLASFVPHSLIEHTIQMKFNDSTVPGKLNLFHFLYHLTVWEINIISWSSRLDISIVACTKNSNHSIKSCRNGYFEVFLLCWCPDRDLEAQIKDFELTHVQYLSPIMALIR